MSTRRRIEVIEGDITALRVDAIVNAANASLSGGGGVDGAIHRAAGPELLAECRGLGYCPTGYAKLTRAYQLPAKYVIHAVGPVWSGGDDGEAELLASCHREALLLAAEHHARSVAFPAISCGAYRFPVHLAAQIAIRTVNEFLSNNETPETVLFVCFEGAVFREFNKALASNCGATP